MELGEYYEEICKTAGLHGVDEDLVNGAIEVLKTAGLIEDEEEGFDEEKIACVQAVCNQFDNDGIDFDDEDEKIAAAVMIVEGYESELEKESAVSDVASRALGKIKDFGRNIPYHAGNLKDIATGKQVREGMAKLKRSAGKGATFAKGRSNARKAIGKGALKTTGLYGAGGLAGMGAHKGLKGKED